MISFQFRADLGPLGNYPGSPFLPSDSEILIDSPEQEDIGIPTLTSSKLFDITKPFFFKIKHTLRVCVSTYTYMYILFYKTNVN